MEENPHWSIIFHMRTLTAGLAFGAMVAISALLGACTGNNSPSATQGFLTSAVGGSAAVTASSQVGVNFALAATLDSNSVVNGSTTSWYCYAANDAEGFPNYQIYSSDGSTYAFEIDVVPAQWVIGQLKIDNVNVSLQVTDASSNTYGVATSGIITLTAAGLLADTPGNYCAFSATNLTLSAVADPNVTPTTSNSD